MEVTASVEINRPPAVVFDYLADMSNNPKWQKGQRRCVWTSDPPLRVGSTYDQEARFLGRTIISSFEVVEFDPGRRIRIRTTGGKMPVDVIREVIAANRGKTDGGASMVNAIVRGDAAGVFGVVANIGAPLLRIMVRNSIRQDYRRLKALLEATA